MNTDFKERTPGSVAKKHRGLDLATRLALVVDRLRWETDPETAHCLVLQAEGLRHLVREDVRRFARASVQRHRTRNEPSKS